MLCPLPVETKKFRAVSQRRDGSREESVRGRCSWKIGTICRGQSRVLIGSPHEWAVRTMPPMFPSYEDGLYRSIGVRHGELGDIEEGKRRSSLDYERRRVERVGDG